MRHRNARGVPCGCPQDDPSTCGARRTYLGEESSPRTGCRQRMESMRSATVIASTKARVDSRPTKPRLAVCKNSAASRAVHIPIERFAPSVRATECVRRVPAPCRVGSKRYVDPRSERLAPNSRSVIASTLSMRNAPDPIRDAISSPDNTSSGRA